MEMAHLFGPQIVLSFFHTHWAPPARHLPGSLQVEAQLSLAVAPLFGSFTLCLYFCPGSGSLLRHTLHLGKVVLGFIPTGPATDPGPHWYSDSRCMCRCVCISQVCTHASCASLGCVPSVCLLGRCVTLGCVYIYKLCVSCVYLVLQS